MLKTVRPFKTTIVSYVFIILFFLLASFFLLQVPVFYRSLWLLFFSVIFHTMFTMKSSYQSINFLYYIMGVLAAAICLARIIGFISAFGDIYGVVVTVGIMVAIIIVLQFFAKVFRIPQIAFGACIYVLLYSSNFTFLNAILAALLVELLGYGIVRSSYLLATKVIERYTLK